VGKKKKSSEKKGDTETVLKRTRKKGPPRGERGIDNRTSQSLSEIGNRGKKRNIKESQEKPVGRENVTKIPLSYQRKERSTRRIVAEGEAKTQDLERKRRLLRGKLA